MKKLITLIFLSMTMISMAQFPPYVPPEGLVAWYSFNGDANDLSGNGNNGVLQGGMAFTTDRFGNPASSLLGNGASSVNIPVLNNFPLGNSSRSVSLFFKIADLASLSSDRDLFAYGDNSGGLRFGIGLHNNRIYVESVNHINEFIWNPNTEWHHLVAVFDHTSNRIKLYLDGVLKLDETPAINYNTTSCCAYIGSLFGPGSYLFSFKGKIDDIGVWDRPLTQQEVDQLFYSVYSTVQASNLTFLNIANNQFTINWIDGNGYRRAAFIKENDGGEASPRNSTTYFADTVFGAGSQVGMTGWYCVFNGTPHPSGVTVTNIKPGTNYRVMVCEYFGSPGFEVYNTDTASGNPKTLINYKIKPSPQGITSAPKPECLTLESLEPSGWAWSTGDCAKSIRVCESGNYFNNSDSVGVFISTFNDSLFTPNGEVHSIFRKGDTVYLGGRFDCLARVTGKGALFHCPADANVTGMPRANGTIDLVVPDEAGGWYIAGDFTKVGIDSIRFFAHIGADQKLDTSFKPMPDGKVKAICLSGNRLYAGGEFTRMGDVSRGYLLQLDKATGMATSWDPLIDGPVNALAIFNDRLYVGGNFTSLGTVPRNCLGAVDTAYAMATAWAPNPDQMVEKLVLEGIKLYVAGNFTTISGVPRTRLASYTVISGNIDTWSPNPDNTVTALVFSGNTVYVAGKFTQVGGGTRSFLAGLNTTNGNVTSWNPQMNDTVFSLAVSDNLLYAGGLFTSVNTSGAPVERWKACAFNLGDMQVNGWSPGVTGLYQQNCGVRSIAAWGDEVYLGGDFYGVNGVARSNLAAINAVSGTVTGFDPRPNGDVRAIYPYNEYIYLGGDFTTVWSGSAHIPRNRIARVSAAGVLSTWNPNADGRVNAFAAKGQYLYAGGAFNNLGGNARPKLTAIKISDGTSSTWAPSPNDSVKAMAIAGDTLFVGGNFTSVASTARGRGASFNLSSMALTSFDPGADSAVEALAVRNNTVYIGGSFQNIGGEPVPMIAAFNANTNLPLPIRLNLYNTSGNSARSLAVGDSAVVAAGKFSYDFGPGLNHNCLAFKPGTQTQSEWWHPDPNGTVNTIFLYKDQVYAGGGFTESLNVFQPFFTAVDNFCSVDNFLPLPSDTSFCEGDSVPLWAAPGNGYTYQWYMDNLPVQGATKRYYIPVATGWYKVYLSDTINYGSIYSNARHVTVDPLASPEIALSGPATFCASSGNSVTLTASSGQNYAYQWYKNGDDISGANDNYYVATTSGDYYCMIYNSFGCPTESDHIVVTVNPLPTAQISGTATICLGQSASLSVVLTGSAPWDITYTDGTTPVNITGINASPYSFNVAPASTSTYAITNVTDANVCSNTGTGSATVTVNPLPTATISGTTAICYGQTAPLTVVLTGTPPWGITYTDGTTPVTLTGIPSSPHTIYVTPSDTKTYTVTDVTDANTCSNTGSGNAVITVNPLPTATISGSTAICAGQPATLTIALSGIPPWSIIYTDGTTPVTLTGITANPHMVTVYPPSTKTYTVTNVTDANTCSNTGSGSVMVTVHPLPTATLSGTTAICLGQSAILTIALTGTPPWNFTYTDGSNPVTLYGITTSPKTVTVTPTMTTTYTVTAVTDANTCSNTGTGSAVITVNTVPSPAGVVSGASQVCQGQLSVAYSTPLISGTTGYVWTLPAGAAIVYGYNTNSIIVNYANTSVSGNVVVYGTNTCGNGPASAPLFVTVDPLPGAAGTITGASPVCQGQQGVAYTVAAIPNATGYVWALSTGAAIASGGNTNSITVNFSNTAVSGNITVYGSNGCGNGTISLAFAVTVNPLPGAAGTISGLQVVCQGQQAVAYWLSPIYGATGYVWSLPSGATIATGHNTNSITVNYSNVSVSGYITVYGTNTCGTGTVSPPLGITVNSLPGPAGAISGPATVCQGETNVAFTVDPIVYASGYVWTLPYGVTISGGFNTNAILVDFSINAASGNITVYGTNSCGYGIISPAHYVTVNPCGFTVSGTVTYPNTSGAPLSNLSIDLKNASGTTVQTTSTSSGGYYSFSGVANGNYSFGVSTVKPWGGVTASDVLLYRKHIASISFLSGIYLASGDVNLSGSLTASDVLLIKKRIGSMINSFPSGNWLFNNLPFTVNNNNVAQNFNGINYGDANASYNPTGDVWASSYPQGLVRIGSLSAANPEIKIPVTFFDMPDLGSFQFTIRYNPEKLTFRGTFDWMEGADSITVGNPVPGILTFVWAAGERGINIIAAQLCNLQFERHTADTAHLVLTGSPTAVEFGDYDGNLFKPMQEGGIIGNITGITENGGLSVYIYPNPSEGKFTIRVSSPANQVSGIQVYNSLGVLVYSDNGPGITGNFTKRIDLSHLPNGVYYVNLNSNDGAFREKIVIGK